MKITRRSDKGKGGHLLVSVPANRLAEVEAALNYLETRRQAPGSQVILELIVRAAKRNGWNPENGHALSLGAHKDVEHATADLD